jgi:hypothetical protein
MPALKQYMVEAQIGIERIYGVVKLLLKYYELMATYDADLSTIVTTKQSWNR